jgi:hypothetical protein
MRDFVFIPPEMCTWKSPLNIIRAFKLTKKSAGSAFISEKESHYINDLVHKAAPLNP